MNTQELLQQVKFIVDAEGKQSGVVLTMEVWEQLLTLVTLDKLAAKVGDLKPVTDTFYFGSLT